jgi:probable addiction module antidote protein
MTQPQSLAKRQPLLALSALHHEKDTVFWCRLTSLSNSESVKLSRYDVSDHLRTPEEMAAYLDAWLDEFRDDVSGIAREMGDIALTEGMAHVGKDAGLNRESLCRALSDKGNPSFSTILKVLGALGLKLTVSVATSDG